MAVRAKEIANTELFSLYGFIWRCERQARRTTFARAVGEPLAGARIQIKHSQAFQPVAEEAGKPREERG